MRRFYISAAINNPRPAWLRFVSLEYQTDGPLTSAALDDARRQIAAEAGADPGAVVIIAATELDD